MKIKKFRLNDLTPAEYNPRVITLEALVGLQKSIKEFGYIQPIVVNIHEGAKTIIAGHQRVKAMIAQKFSEADCVVVDFDPLKEKAANIAMNSETISGDWDFEGLESLLGELKIDFSGFEEVNLDELADSLDIDLESDETGGGEKKEADSVPEIEKQLVIRSGDLIELGSHKVLCGDYTDGYCQIIIQQWCDFTGNDKIVVNGKEVSWNEYKE